MSVDWTQLPPELVQSIAEKLPIYGDYLRFLAVCRAWRSSVPSTAPPSHLPPQLPWLMLPHSQTQVRPSTRAFFDLSTNTVHLLNLPEASHQKRHCGSSHGWLILLDERPEILVLNPLSRAKLPLPPLSSFPNIVSFNYSDIGREYSLVSPSGDRFTRSLRQMRDSFMKKVVLSSSPARDPQFTALAILNLTGDLAFCNNGDESWRLIEGAQSYCEDAIYYRDSFYAVDKYGAIAVCDVRDRSSSPRVSVISTPRQFGGDMQYLVSSDDELLLVTRFLDLEFDYEPDRPHLVYRTTRFEVFKLDLVGWQWQRDVWRIAYTTQMTILRQIMMVYLENMMLESTTYQMGALSLCLAIQETRFIGCDGLPRSGSHRTRFKEATSSIRLYIILFKTRDCAAVEIVVSSIYNHGHHMHLYAV